MTRTTKQATSEPARFRSTGLELHRPLRSPASPQQNTMGGRGPLNSAALPRNQRSIESRPLTGNFDRHGIYSFVGSRRGTWQTASAQLTKEPRARGSSYSIARDEWCQLRKGSMSRFIQIPVG